MKWVQAENDRMGYRDDSQWINPAAWQAVRVIHDQTNSGWPTGRVDTNSNRRAEEWGMNSNQITLEQRPLSED